MALNHTAPVASVRQTTRTSRARLTRFTSTQAGGLKRHTFKVGGGSYLSSHDSRMVLSIGSQTQIDWIEVKWPKPSSLVECFVSLPLNQYVTIEEGKGRKITSASARGLFDTALRGITHEMGHFATRDGRSAESAWRTTVG